MIDQATRRRIGNGWLWLAVTGICLFSSCNRVLKPAAPDRRMRVDTEGSVFAASNGYLFAVAPEPKSKVIQLEVRYPVGSAQDPVGKEGLAHLVEHLLFEVEVTRETSTSSVAAELSRVALGWNATTAHDYTSYVTRVAPAALDDVLRLESERLLIGCQGISPEVFAREKEVVLNELRQRWAAGESELSQAIYQTLYPPEHPYHRLGSVESVGTIERDDVCQFLADQYQRGRAVVVISGNVTADAARAAVGRHFQKLPVRKTGGQSVPPPVAQTKSKMTVIEADVEEPFLMLAWPMPPIASKEFRLAQMATGAMSGRLNAFAFTYKWGHGADVTTVGGDYAPFVVLSVTLGSPGKAGEARDAAQKAVKYAFRTLYRSGEEATSLRWQRRLRGRAQSLIGRYETLGGRVEMFADFLQFDPEGGFLIGRLEEDSKVTPNEARKIAEKWLAPSKARVILVKRKPSSSGRIAASRGFGGIYSDTHRVEVDERAADQPLALPPDTGLTLDTIRYETGNHIKVVLWPHGDLPVVHGRLVVSSGSAHEPRGAEGLASLSGFDDIYDDTIVYWQRTLSTWVDDLIEDICLELRYPGRSISDDTKSFLKGRLRMTRAAERLRYNTDFLAAIYGREHPYARPPMTEKSISKIGTDKIKGWARKHIVPANATLIITGKFDPELVKKHIEYQSDQVSAGSDSERIDVPPRGDTPAWIVGFGRQDARVVEIDLGFPGGPGLRHDYAARLVLELILDAELSVLRDELAVSYGFYAHYTPRVAGGEWRIRGSADAARATEAVSALRDLMAKLQRSPDSYRANFVLARRKALDRLLAHASDSLSVAERLEFMARFGLDDQYYDRLAHDIAELKPEAVHELLRTELRPERQVFGAFGPKEAVRAAVRAAQAE